MIKSCANCAHRGSKLVGMPCKVCIDYSEYEKDKGEWVIEKIGIEEALGDFQKFVGDLINPYVCPQIDRVIYNDPATIILWKDGTKTVVKCMEGEDYDPEKGFAMAVLKKLFGEDYGKVMKEFVKPELRKREEVEAMTFNFTTEKFPDGLFMKLMGVDKK